MKAFAILKKIYTDPLTAFDGAELQESLGEAIALAAGLWLISLPIGYWAGLYRPAGWPGVLFTVFDAIGGLGIILLTVWISRKMVYRERRLLSGRQLLSGMLWIAIALLPLNILEQITGSRWLPWVNLAAAIGLAGICIHCLTSLSIKTSFRILILAFLLAFAAGMLYSSILLVLRPFMFFIYYGFVKVVSSTGP